MDIAKKGKTSSNFSLVPIYFFILVLVAILLLPKINKSGHSVPSQIRSVFDMLTHSWVIRDPLDNPSISATSPTVFVYPTATPTILPVPDYGNTDSWKVFTNSKYGYSIKYPQLSFYEAKSTEESPTAKTNQYVSFQQEGYYQGGTRLFPWIININANFPLQGTQEGQDFKSKVEISIEGINKAYNSELVILNEKMVGNRSMIIVGNDKLDTASQILYALVEKPNSSNYLIIHSESIAGGRAEDYKKFFYQFVSTFNFTSRP